MIKPINVLVIISTLFLLVIGGREVSAADGNNFNPGNIIDDSVFYNSSSMSAEQVQSFLDSKVPSCDTNGTGAAVGFNSGMTRAAYAASRGWQSPPYTCMRNYSQATPQMEAASGYCSAIASASSRSAANIIKDVASACGINPQVLIVLLEKEQSLVTDVWPLNSQYTKATGFACPDTAPCNSSYGGFFYQVYYAARQFKVYQANQNSYNYIAGRSNRIYWQTNLGDWVNASGNLNTNYATCGYSNVYIQNQATAALYIYTPYQPNQKALASLYGSGDACSAYGNRNFWRLFTDWFGKTTGPDNYWRLSSVNVFADAAYTRQVRTNGSELFLEPGQRVYVRVTARNEGRTTWIKGQTRLGTYSPIDYFSSFADASWLAPFRITNFVENSVAPSETATYEFALTAPNNYGFYTEAYNLVTENVAWFNDSNLRLYMTVQKPASTNNSTQQVLDPTNNTLFSSNTLLSNDGHSVLKLQSDGSLDLFTNFARRWTSSSEGTRATKLVLQSDGNLVLYTSANQPVWSSRTHGTQATKLVLQSDGNLVLYTSANQPVWSSGTSIQDQTGLVNRLLPDGLTMYPGQSLTTPDRNYSLVYQLDGNVVLNAPTGPIWSTNTYQSSLGSLGLQSDGNLVLTNKNGNVIWSSGTGTKGRSNLLIQQDGNLVLYSNTSQPTWSSGTAGRR